MQCNNDYFKNKFESCKGNIKETYKIIYNLLNRNEKSTLPSHFNEKIQANEFGCFFTQKVKLIRETFKNNIKNNLVSYHSNFNVHALTFFKEVNKDELLQVIKSLPNKQTVTDALPCTLFKSVAVQLLPYLLEIINSSFRLGYFSMSFKCSVITHILLYINFFIFIR